MLLRVSWFELFSVQTGLLSSFGRNACAKFCRYEYAYDHVRTWTCIVCPLSALCALLPLVVGIDRGVTCNIRVGRSKASNID